MVHLGLKYRVALLVVLVVLLFLASYELFSLMNRPPRVLRGFGWYGYLADDDITEGSLKKIKELGGNSVSINVYYEYDPGNTKFVLKSNLTKVAEKIKLAHSQKLIVFLSPFANMRGGHYMASQINDTVKEYLEGARNISVELAKFSEDNNVEIYAVWNELGITLYHVPNSTNITSEWLQDTRSDVDEVYGGLITTREGVQTGQYRKLNFSGFDYIGVTFYPFTSSTYTDPYSNVTFWGTNSLEEYEKVINYEFDGLTDLKAKFNNKGIILGEVGIDVVNGDFVWDDLIGQSIRSKAYEMVLKDGSGRIDGFYFTKFEHGNGGSDDLDTIFKLYFSR
jgi:hypothetical protein